MQILKRKFWGIKIKDWGPTLVGFWVKDSVARGSGKSRQSGGSLNAKEPNTQGTCWKRSQNGRTPKWEGAGIGENMSGKIQLEWERAETERRPNQNNPDEEGAKIGKRSGREPERAEWEEPERQGTRRSGGGRHNGREPERLEGAGTGGSGTTRMPE